MPSARGGSGRLARPDSAGDLRSARLLSHFEIVVRLKVHPKLGGGSEVARQPESGVRGDWPPATNDAIHSVYRNQQFHCQPIGCQAKRFQKVFPQRFTGMYRNHGFGYLGHNPRSSGAGDNLDLKGIRFNPAEADPPLLVDPNAVLPQAIAVEGLQAIPWNRSEIGNHHRRMNMIELSFCRAGNALKPLADLAPEDLLGLLVPERPNHSSRILPLRVERNAVDRRSNSIDWPVTASPAET